MRKNIIAIIATIIVSMSLAACGNNNASATSTTEYSNTGSQNQTSNTEVEPTENPANVDNSGHEPDSYRSGNFQDYWEGEDYFDIVGFAEANGCTKIFWYDADNNKCDITSSSINRIAFFYGDWHIFVYMNQIQAVNSSTDEVHSMVSTRDTNTVSICSQNSFKIYSDVCQGFNDILEEIKSN